MRNPLEMTKRRNISICSYNERENYRSQQTTHLITIANPGADNEAPT